MSICFFCSSALPLPETREKIADANVRFHDVLRHFWISDGRELAQNDREEAAAHGFNALSGFIIQWNKEEGSELISRFRASFTIRSDETMYSCTTMITT